MPNLQEPLDPVLHALANPARRAMVEQLGRGPATVSELAGPLAIALPSAMQHLRVLEASGLIRSQKEGRVRTCHLRPEALGSVTDWMAEQRAVWTGRLDRLDHYLKNLQEQKKEKP